jgi:hydrogenase maturation protease
MQLNDPIQSAAAQDPNDAAPAVTSTCGCLVIGLGNSLLRDDGIGVHAARELAKASLEGVQVLEVGTDVFSAVSWLESVPRALVIDAMDAGGLPGTLYQCGAQDIQVDPVRASLHELSLLAVMEFIPRDKRPAITILGVQPAVIDYGLELSPNLRNALPRVVEAARAILAGWLPRPAGHRKPPTSATPIPA